MSKVQNNITRVKILHDTTYTLIQRETNNYMKNVISLGGQIIGNPQLNLKRLPSNIVQGIQKEINNKIQQQQKALKNLPDKVYYQCVKIYSKQHPSLKLDPKTNEKALKFYGLTSLIKEIKSTQQEVIKQYKQRHNILSPNTQVSDLQYYMKITYKMPYQIYQISKQWL